ncbi:uncharacterized protein C19orf44 homolog isoform X2 [Etheostoma cragini]|uniref:uncharacterized protein C19orf44 homolog isoform X2 n=1 Tax=Etheostoma cragini TaxID=417921 RepID=UPI00155DF94C|nr:uncharacterized protein C19orf44 homolog isoform X2 [Etheostoma cragini]
MWKRGGRSFALDRAQVLLSAKRNSRGRVQSVQVTTVHTRAVKNRFSSLNTHPSLSDLSDLSSVSSAPEHVADTLDSADAKTQRRDDSTKDLRPQSSLGGVGSRFLKKALATNSRHSPISKSHMQQVPKHRNASSSQQGSQTAALRRLVHIESHIHSGMQVQEHARHGQKSVENLTSDVGISPPPVAHSLEAPVQFSAKSSSDKSLKGKRFLKNVTSVAVDSSITTAARPPNEADFCVRSIAGDAVVTSGGLEKKSVRVVSGVSLESDEEDIQKLLGGSLDSIDNNFSIPGRCSFRRRADELLSKSSQKAYSSPLPATLSPSSSPNTATPHSPASPSRHSSPFRFLGQTQAHFSPSVLSVSSSPSCVSPSPPLSNSPHRGGSPQRSLLSMSCHDEVLSLEELFVGPDSEYPHSEISAVTSEDFKINVMTLDDLVPATLELTEETPGKEREVKQSTRLFGSPNRHQQQLRYNEKEKKEEQQEGALDYQKDFESENKTESKYSVNQISEHLQEDGDEEKVVPEVREEDSDVSCERTEDNYLSTFSDTGRSYTSQSLDHCNTCRCRDSKFSVSHDSWSLTRKSRRHASTRKVLKEAEVQTQPIQLALTRPAGMATLSPAMGITYLDHTPVVAHTLSAEMVEALSTFDPAVFTLNEMLKQQLAMTRCFIERGRHLHSSLVQSLGPPNYRYNMLEDTKEYICKHRPPKLTMEEALEEVLQEIRDSHV